MVVMDKTTKTRKTDVKAEALAKLQAWLPSGTTVYTILRHVSESGTYRIIDLVIIREDRIESISWLVSQLGLYKMSNPGPTSKYGLKVSGCGMDMGFDVVYNLGYALSGDGYGLRQVWL